MQKKKEEEEERKKSSKVNTRHSPSPFFFNIYCFFGGNSRINIIISSTTEIIFAKTLKYNLS